MTLPGVAPTDRLRLNAEARELVVDAVRRGDRLDRLVLHVEPQRVTLARRDDVARSLRTGGVASLAKRLERALVPAGAVLLLVDVDGATQLVLAPIAKLAGDAADTQSAALATKPGVFR